MKCTRKKKRQKDDSKLSAGVGNGRQNSGKEPTVSIQPPQLGPPADQRLSPKIRRFQREASQNEMGWGTTGYNCREREEKKRVKTNGLPDGLPHDHDWAEATNRGGTPYAAANGKALENTKKKRKGTSATISTPERTCQKINKEKKDRRRDKD